MSKEVIGWDIGGAHVKTVALDAQGRVVAAIQQPCALWKGLPLLRVAITDISQRLASIAAGAQHVVTMTGELVDLFADRAEGVRVIAGVMHEIWPNAVFYHADAQQTGFTREVTGRESAVASMNWHASASYLATICPDPGVLVMDVGSTTTDITLCLQGKLQVYGWTDAERMQCGGLLYSGVVRTPLMAFGHRLPWQGRLHYLAAEYFATTADVYRLLGELPSQHDLADTADGQDKSMDASMRRLARMVGADASDQPPQAWQALAQAFAHRQLAWMQEAVTDALAHSATSPCLVGLGAGAFLLPGLASQLELTYQPASRWVVADSPALHAMAMVCFPAYAVARLWQ